MNSTNLNFDYRTENSIANGDKTFPLKNHFILYSYDFSSSEPLYFIIRKAWYGNKVFLLKYLFGDLDSQELEK